MSDTVQCAAARLSDGELLRRVVLLARRERAATVELIAHLAELDARRLHVAEGWGSLFSYCTQALHLAEHAAYNRIEAARLSRRFPVVLELLAGGALNLSTLRLLAPHLTPDTFDALTAAARGRSKREVEALIAGWAPRPDVAPSVRRLPARSGRDAGSGVASLGPAAGPAGPAPDPVARHQSAVLIDAVAGSARTPAPESEQSPVPSTSGEAVRAGAGAAALTAHRPVVAALAPRRYRVQFTVGDETHDKLRQAQALLRREIPDGDPGAIFDRALTLLLEDVARKKVALTPKPRPAKGQDGRSGGASSSERRSRSRRIPAHVRRAVWLRDGSRCAFVARGGRRCAERTFLEFHHREAYAVGGEATVANISLRCRAHNVYEAELAFGVGARVTRNVDLRPG